ncbi:MAG: hypothetical protein M1313_10975 [Nitrospirae bacterium]|nr:hypothetical protein [Nitrospirota bacterium]
MRGGSSQEIRSRITSGQGVEEIEIEGRLFPEVEVETFQKTRLFGIPEFEIGKKIPEFKQNTIDLLMLQGQFFFHGTRLPLPGPSLLSFLSGKTMGKIP